LVYRPSYAPAASGARGGRVIPAVPEKVRIRMSGGTYDYEYRRIGNMADDIRPTTVLRKAFKTHLRKVARACHDIEWVDSGDCAAGDEIEAIRACLGEDGKKLVLAEALEEARFALAQLKTAIGDAVKI